MKSSNPEEFDKRNWIAGLDKGLQLLSAFSDTQPRLTVSTAALRTGMTRAAARRYLLTLNHLGFADSDGKYFWLTPKVLRLGWSYFESARLPRTAIPFLQRLAQTLGETCSLCVLDEGDMVIVARHNTSRVQNFGFVQGARVSAHLTAAGMAMMATKSDEEIERWLDQRVLVPYTPYSLTTREAVRDAIHKVRADGYAVSDQQLVPGVRAVAIAMRNMKLDLLGALSVSIPSDAERPKDSVKRVLPALQQTVSALLPLL